MSQAKFIAEKFYAAFCKKQWVGKPLPDIFNLSLYEAYQIQNFVTQMRIEQGDLVKGFKVGCTSQAIRTQFNLSEPIRAKLFSPYCYKEGVALNWKKYANCAIEPEMIMRIARDLHDKDLSDKDLINAIDYVSPGIELHNYTFWHSPPTSQELICSNGLHAGLIMGSQKVEPQCLTFKDERFAVFKNDELVTQATASEIMGGPLKSLRWLVNSLVEQGQYLNKGSLVIPGSPVELIEIKEDTTVTIEIGDVGRLSTLFTSDA